MKFTFLKWDSDFFGFNVVRVNGKVSTNKEFEKVVQKMSNENIRLAYYSTKDKLSFSPHNLGYKNIEYLLVDKKTTFLKKVDYNTETCKNVVSKMNQEMEPKLLELAIESGKHSRFHKDPNISYKKYVELYSLWIKNSINGSLADDVLTYVEDGLVLGFVTLGNKNRRADIGLIAVDSMHRGKGIAKNLMRSADNRAGSLGFDMIQVVTQGENIGACRLYESCGYRVESSQYFYHIWNNGIKEQNENQNTIQ